MLSNRIWRIDQRIGRSRLTILLRYCLSRSFREESPMNLADCVFCGVALTQSSLNQQDSRTKEHVYARWFRDYVVNDKIKMFTSDGKTSAFHEQKDLEKFWNRSVCAKCNNGWMSRLEVTVDPIINQLTTGTEFNQLGPEEVETLARWTGKTAIVLGYLTPFPAFVPEFIRRTFLPDSPTAPHMRLFYASIKADNTLEGGYLQLGYAAEIPVIGKPAPSGLRFTLCVYNHLFTADFPPMLAGLRYDLRNSVSAEVWPSRAPAGTAQLDLTPPVLIGDLLIRIASGIQAQFDIGKLHV